MKLTTAALLLSSFAAMGCRPAPAWVPLATIPVPRPEVTIVWVGHGETERFENGEWRRVPEFDYEFSVEQRRYADRWESVKSLRRRHPGYDGSSGPRDQTMFFLIELSPKDEKGRVKQRVQSSLGAGEGFADAEFRVAQLELRPEISRFAPFDRYRISQAYGYEVGELKETIELNKGTSPWVRVHEVAQMYAKHRFEAPPTTRQ